MAWSIALRNLADTATSTANAAFRTAQFTWAADGTGSFEIDLSQAHGQSGEWVVGQRRVILKDESATRRFAGWLEHLDRSGAPSAIQYKAAGRGLASILAYRIVHGDFNQVDQVRTNAAIALINHMTAQTDDKTNFSAGTITGVPGSVSRYYGDGDVIQDAIDELAQAAGLGFAWEIDENGKFNAWANGRGSDLSATFSLADSDTISWQIAWDVSDLVTYATGIGNANDNSQLCGPPVTIDESSTLAADYGRREAVVETNTTDTTEMSGLAKDEARAREAASVSLTTVWIEGRGPWDFGDVWIGDTVTGVLGSEFGGDTDIRCTSVQLTLEPGADNSEFVQMTWEKA